MTTAHTPDIPPALRYLIAGREPDPLGKISGDDWLTRLPHLISTHLKAWDLTPDGDPTHGDNALIQPVRRSNGTQAALKLTWPHASARHEHLALRHWDGRGAVRLLAADPADAALLLERLSSRDLRTVNILEACEEIGRIIGLLDRPAPPQLDTIDHRAASWSQSLAQGTPLVPRRMTAQAASELDALVASAPPSRLVHTDLHDGNVLAPLDAARGPWLAIDPKPVAAEWAYAVAPIVWNRPEETARAHNLRFHARLRTQIVAEEAGLDDDRVRAWTHVRLVLNAVNASAYAPASDEFRARMIALAKAFAS